MGAVGTVLDVVTDSRTYYNCPKCGRRVWAYGSFAGNVCWECPGTLVSAAAKTVDTATFGATSSITSTVADTITDTKRYYKCPKCNREVWAYGTFEGNVCWECPGTLVSAAAKTVDATTLGTTSKITSTVADAITDTKRYYKCPKCNREVWAYGTFEGNVCWECSGTLVSAAGKVADVALDTALKKVDLAAVTTLDVDLAAVTTLDVNAATKIVNAAMPNVASGINSTITDAITDTKRCYKCPKCNREVWAYGAFEGNVCQECSGTLISATAKTVDAATENAFSDITSTAADVLTDTKRHYPCPKCGENVWAYGAFQNKKCWNCHCTVEGLLEVVQGLN